MDTSYSVDNINNIIRVIKGMEWAGRDLNSMVELGYIIVHGDFSDDNLIGRSVPYIPHQFCTVPYRYISYSLGDRLGDKNEDIVRYFRVAIGFIINYIKELWHEVLQKLNEACYRDTWMYKELFGFIEENRDKYPEQYLEIMLL